MRRRRAVLALGTAAVLLAGCGGSDPGDVRRQHVADVTAAANDRDADELRDRAQALVDLVAEQRESGEVDEAEAARLTELAQAVQRSADAVDDELLEQARIEAERKKLEEERKRLEEEREKAEADAKQSEEDAKKAEEEREKAEEEAKKDEEERKKDEEKDD